MFSQVFICLQSASWLLIHCLALLQLGQYASYWNAFLYHELMVYYHPQRSCEGYVFTPVCQSRGGVSATVHAEIPPLGAGTHSGAGTPPIRRHPPGAGTFPPADGYCCGQYVSYWNAFFLNNFFSSVQTHST